MTVKLSSSGARVRGDDYQHLFTWLKALEAFTGDIDWIGIEDPVTSNADDVTVRGKSGKWHCYQAKYSTDSSHVADIGWLTKPGKKGPSMIQRFYKLWSGMPKNRPTITLVTNRLPAHGDALMSMIDGNDCTVARRLQQTKPASDRVRASLAEHLDTTEDDAVSFFSDVRFMLGCSKPSLECEAKSHMRAAGLRNNDRALLEGVEIVRSWVTGGQVKITAQEVRMAARRLMRTSDAPTASLSIQMLGRDQDLNATISLDWTGLFPDNAPGARCLPSDPELWNGKFRPELIRVAQQLWSVGGAHVLVRGSMRLPTWFMAGAVLRKTAGFEVSSVQGINTWSSIGEPDDVDIECNVHDLEHDEDLAVGIALACDPSADVLSYLRDSGIGAKYASIRPAGGAGNYAISGAAEARGWALGARDAVRSLVRENRPACIHLFLAGPHAAVLLLGHLWDRMPRTQLYEYLGSTGDYAPSYTILY